MAKIAPGLSDLLCENCGYILNGLPDSGNCPECGSPVRDSLPDHRRPPTAWDLHQPGPFRALVETSIAVIFRPAHFYRNHQSRGWMDRARSFALIHWLFSALLLATAGCIHFNWMDYGHSAAWRIAGARSILIWASLLIVIYATFYLTTLLAARLTAFEGGYRGLRLPLDAVRRALFYHAAHLTPVAIAALITIDGYTWLLRLGWVSYTSLIAYLIILSAQVILSAIYLFLTYWAGMKNIMFANR